MNNATIAKLCDLRSGECPLQIALLFPPFFFVACIHLLRKVSGEVVELLSTLCHANGRFVPLNEPESKSASNVHAVQKTDKRNPTQNAVLNCSERMNQSGAIKAILETMIPSTDTLCAVGIIFNLLHLEA